MKTWTLQEEIILRDYFNKEDINILEGLLPKHRRGAIKAKARRLGLVESKPSHNEGLLDFKTIDTEEKAYILGFIAADGCLISSSYRLTVSQTESDRNILFKIRDILGANLSIIKVPMKATVNKKTSKSYSRNDEYRLIINSKVLYEQMLGHGIMPRKSFSLDRPITVPDSLVCHYIRGYVEGDGSVILANGKPRLAVYSGSFALLSYIKDKFDEVYNSGSSVLPDRTIYKIDISGYPAYRLVKFIYEDATLYLDRKKEVADKILDITYTKEFKPHLNKRWNQDEKKFLVENYESLGPAKIAEVLGKQTGSVVARMSYTRKKTGDYSERALEMTKNRKGKWTEEEVAFLLSNYLIMTYKELADHLGRTTGSIDQKVQQVITTRKRRGNYAKAKR